MSFSQKFGFLLLCTGAVAGDAQAQTASRPIVDAHQHLWSAASAAHFSDNPRAATKLPADLSAFMSARSNAAMNRAALRAVYIDNATMLESFNPGYIVGADSIVDWWVGATESPYDLRPVGYAVSGNAAYVTSYLVDRKAQRIDAHMVHSLARDKSGKWLITSEVLTMGAPLLRSEISADTLIPLLDAAGIRIALVHSIAYLYSSSPEERPGEYEKVKAENDWNAQQAARYPDRLRAFCSFSPLRSHALRELERCADAGTRGIKLHMGNSRVDLTSAAHLAKLREVFAAANRRRLPIGIHLATYGTTYGARAAQNFLEQVLSAAPDIAVQIAHMGSPGRLDETSDSALVVLVNAASNKDPRARNLWFDVTTVVDSRITAAKAKVVAERIRQIGVERVVYGSDTPDAGHMKPREGWAAFRTFLPLTDAEFDAIARNVPPYAR